MLDANYFGDRKDLESNGLQWGESKALNKEQFTSLMRIELRRSPPKLMPMLHSCIPVSHMVMAC
jgi:hypothetical protein